MIDSRRERKQGEKCKKGQGESGSVRMARPKEVGQGKNWISDKPADTEVSQMKQGGKSVLCKQGRGKMVKC